MNLELTWLEKLGMEIPERGKVGGRERAVGRARWGLGVGAGLCCQSELLSSGLLLLITLGTIQRHLRIQVFILVFRSSAPPPPWASILLPQTEQDSDKITAQTPPFSGNL